MKTAELKNRELARQIADQYESARGIQMNGLPMNEANTLRRAQLTLHRWAELKCGDGRGHIERDEQTGKPFYYNDSASYVQPNDPRRVSPIADREAGALRRIAQVCKAAGLHFYHQADPRGCALYVSHEPLTDQNYSRGIACL
jgi:hypothetical protein